MKLYREWLLFNGIKFSENPIGFMVTYQGASFVIPYNYDDKQFLQILMPDIYNASDKTVIALKIINQLHLDLKVVKATLNSKGYVGLSIEMFIDSSPVIDEYMERLFDILFEARSRFMFMISLSETLSLK